MKQLNTTLKVIFGLIIVAFLAFGGVIGNYHYQRWVDNHAYEELKQVEDTARAMVSNFELNKIMYEQYLDEGKDEWASQAKIRANKIAIQYNEYILKNSFKFEGNIPEDINVEIEILK